MSSTSSSDCENCNCSECTYVVEDKRNNCIYHRNSKMRSKHGSIFTTMAHPLIYYAEVPRPNRRQPCGQPRKEANCFVKAFKWYTQERVPEKYEFNPDMNSFANWLDSKYVEYLCENRQNECYQLRTKETTTIEPCAPCGTCEQSTTKKFSRIKSPWKKLRRPCNDAGDLPTKDQSCEFIMQPKDLSRAVSDNCYQTPTCGMKSNATVVSSNAPCSLKCSGKSQSLSSICREKSAMKHIDTIPNSVQEGPKTQKPVKPTEPCACHHDEIQQVPSTLRTVSVTCQIPEEKVVAVNVEIQCEHEKEDEKENKQEKEEHTERCCCAVDTKNPPISVILQENKQETEEHTARCSCDVDTKNQPISKQSSKISNPPVTLPVVSLKKVLSKKQKKEKKLQILCQCPEDREDRNIEQADTQMQYQSDHEVAPKRERQEVNQIFGPKPMRRQSQSTVTVNGDTCDCTAKEIAIVSKITRSPACCVTSDVQTSDHALCFEKGVVQYPLFLKIICADKLNTDGCHC